MKEKLREKLNKLNLRGVLNWSFGILEIVEKEKSVEYSLEEIFKDYAYDYAILNNAKITIDTQYTCTPNKKYKGYNIIIDDKVECLKIAKDEIKRLEEVGKKTCKAQEDLEQDSPEEAGLCYSTQCNYFFLIEGRDRKPRYCPNCGKKLNIKLLK